MAAPVESKVKAASAAALIASFIVGWVVVKAPGLAGLSEPLTAAVVALITAVATGAAGWLANHTPRPPGA